MAVIIKIYCNQCLGETNHEPVRVYEQLTPENETVIWQIVRCNGCETPSFYREHRSETEQGSEIIGQALFPPRLYLKPKHFVDAPANLDEVYKETIDCFNRRSSLFCAGGLRSLVEGICADQGVVDGPKRDWEHGGFRENGQGVVLRGNTLDCLIEGLAERGLLTQAQAQTLHNHRYLGNEALHELKAPEVPVLVRAISILETVMENLYNMQAHADELVRLREQARVLEAAPVVEAVQIEAPLAPADVERAEAQPVEPERAEAQPPEEGPVE